MKPFFFFAALLFSLTASAQTPAPAQKRIEIDMADWFDDETVYPFGEEGFVLSSYGDRPVKGDREWKYVLYDSDLNEAKTIVEKVPEPFGPPVRCSTGDELVSFYHKKNGSFLLQNMRVANLDPETVTGKIHGRVHVKETIVLKDYIYLNAGIHRNPYLIIINRKTGSSHTVPIKIKGMKDILITHMEALEESNEVFVYIQADKDRKVQCFVMQFDAQGQEKDMLHLNKGSKKQIKYATGYRVDDSTCLYMGTYSSRFSSPVEGIFVCRTKDDRIDFVRYHNFTSLKNFFGYLSERMQAKVEQKKAKSKAKGKERTYRYYIASHEVIPVTGGYLFLGESYYPTYHTETYTTGNGSTMTRTVFDGYQYTHAFVAKFSPEGELLWDQAFPMSPSYKPYRVRLFVTVAELTDQSITMAFSTGSRIVSKTIGLDGDVISDLQSGEITSGETGGIVKYTYSDMTYWYGNHFLAYGRQTIKNPEAGKKERKRKIFFVNKIDY